MAKDYYQITRSTWHYAFTGYAYRQTAKADKNYTAYTIDFTKGSEVKTMIWRNILTIEVVFLVLVIILPFHPSVFFGIGIISLAFGIFAVKKLINATGKTGRHDSE